MRIDVVMLISGLDAKTLEHRRELLSSYASLGTEVRLVTMRNTPAAEM